MVNTFLCTYVSHLGAGVHMAAVTVYKQIRVKGNHTFHGPHCFLSPSLLPQLERRWNFLQLSASRGTPLSLHMTELFTGFKKPESSPVQSWPCQGSSMAHHCLMELRSDFSAWSSMPFTQWPWRSFQLLFGEEGVWCYPFHNDVLLFPPLVPLFMVFSVPKKPFPALPGELTFIL